MNSYRIVWTRKQTIEERNAHGSGRMCEVETIRRASHDRAVAYGMTKAAETGWTFIAAEPLRKGEAVHAQ